MFFKATKDSRQQPPVYYCSIVRSYRVNKTIKHKKLRYYGVLNQKAVDNLRQCDPLTLLNLSDCTLDNLSNCRNPATYMRKEQLLTMSKQDYLNDLDTISKNQSDPAYIRLQTFINMHYELINQISKSTKKAKVKKRPRNYTNIKKDYQERHFSLTTAAKICNVSVPVFRKWLEEDEISNSSNSID